jgi:hypothetical protein
LRFDSTYVYIQEIIFAEDSTDWGWPQLIERDRIERPDSGFIDAQGIVRIAVIIADASAAITTDWYTTPHVTVRVILSMH